MKPNILTDFLFKCIPPDAQLMFNNTLEVMVYFRMGDGYDQLVSALSMNDPYPFGFKDTIIEIMNACLMDIAHDHGIIAANHSFPDLLKLCQSLQHLIQSPDPDVIDDALVAWEHDPKVCYQTVLQGHGGITDIQFHEVVLQVAVSAIDKLRNHCELTRNKLDAEVEAALDSETTPDPEKEHKRSLLRRMNAGSPRPEMVLGHITSKFLDIGHPIEEMIDDVQPEFESYMPGSPETAAVNLLALTLLGTGLVANLTVDAKKMTEKFYNDTGHIAMVNEQIDVLTIS